jgi:predicted RecB family nuclease
LLDAYKQCARTIWRTTVPETHLHEGMPPIALLKENRYQVVLDPLISSTDLIVHPDALFRTAKARKSVTFGSVRFLKHEQICSNDRLMLALDALALSKTIKNLPLVGKAVHGPQYAVSTVPLSKWQPRARSHLKALLTTLQTPTTPPLVLNKHCPACEFRLRCRRLAIEQDNLTLLGNIHAKDCEKLANRGIFTVTQLSYTYRPRRSRKINRLPTPKHDAALKALAIRKGIVHVLGEPCFGISPKQTIYIDVEGLSDPVFYYLIGIRINDDNKDVQHSFLANTPAEERDI